MLLFVVKTNDEKLSIYKGSNLREWGESKNFNHKNFQYLCVQFLFFYFFFVRGSVKQFN